jgi:hypothetical protein
MVPAGRWNTREEGGTVEQDERSLRFTAIYEDAGDGWVMARIVELPEVITQGASEEEAREMVQSALRD